MQIRSSNDRTQLNWSSRGDKPEGMVIHRKMRVRTQPITLTIQASNISNVTALEINWHDSKNLCLDYTPQLSEMTHRGWVDKENYQILTTLKSLYLESKPNPIDGESPRL